MLPLKVILHFLSYLLSQSELSRKRLSTHSEKTISFNGPLGSVLFRITHDGYIEEIHDGEVVPDLSLTVGPEAVHKWLVKQEPGWDGVKVEGDAQFAADLSSIIGQLDWDYEEELAKIFGDSIAHRLGRMLRALKDYLLKAKHSIESSVGEYLTEESQLIASRGSVNRFIYEVDELSDAANRMEKKISILERNVSPDENGFAE